VSRKAGGRAEGGADGDGTLKRSELGEEARVVQQRA
jgi:hypothetical protein